MLVCVWQQWGDGCTSLELLAVEVAAGCVCGGPDGLTATALLVGG